MGIHFWKQKQGHNVCWGELRKALPLQRATVDVKRRPRNRDPSFFVTLDFLDKSEYNVSLHLSGMMSAMLTLHRVLSNFLKLVTTVLKAAALTRLRYATLNGRKPAVTEQSPKCVHHYNTAITTTQYNQEEAQSSVILLWTNLRSAHNSAVSFVQRLFVPDFACS